MCGIRIVIKILWFDVLDAIIKQFDKCQRILQLRLNFKVTLHVSDVDVVVVGLMNDGA
jgi:hypothetical protein